MGTRDQARRLAVRFFLDEFGRADGKVFPFYIYCKLPNYEPLSQYETEVYTHWFEKVSIPFSDYKMLRKLKRTGIDYAEAAAIIGDNTFTSYCSMLQSILERHGFHFTIEEVETMFTEAQTLSVARYARLRKKAERSIARNGELRVTFPELYDLYGNRLVYFVNAYCGVGKSTFIQKQRTALARRKKVVLDDSSRFITKPLADLFVVDSGEHLPSSGVINREQVTRTIPLASENYIRALSSDRPIAVVDAGSSLEQRVNMLIVAKRFRGENSHVEMLKASLLEALIRNEGRARKEYTLEPEKVVETYNVLSQLATSCHQRDFSSPTYRRMYKLLYTGKWCAWTKGPCRFTAHEPYTECGQLCNHCLIHCPHNRFGSRQRRLQLNEYPPFRFPIDGVFL